MNLKELSQSLGLSQTTVSRALNGYPEVGAATRERVMAAAAAAGYSPNARARRLATGRAMAISHVLPITQQNEQTNPIFADFIAGAGEVYARHGYDLLLTMVPEEAIEDAYRKISSMGSADAVMVQSPLLRDSRIDLLKEVGLPFLVHGRSETDSDYSWLDIANARAFRRATEFLIDLGHEKIALINGPETFDFARRRRRGFTEGLESRDLAPQVQWMTTGQMTEQYGYASACELLDSRNRPTAFLVSSIISAIGVRRAVGERGLRTGKDISIICHDDCLSYISNEGASTPNGPAFTATQSSIRAAGRRCAELLLRLLDEPNQPPVRELWEAPLVLGRSTGPAP